MMAEHNCEELSRELLCAKEKIDTMNTQICNLEREIANLQVPADQSCKNLHRVNVLFSLL